MKKALLTFVFGFIIISISAQSNKTAERIMHGILAPDGSVAMTVTHDFKEETIKLKSVTNFYKYQLLDSKTSEPVLTSSNRGKECTFDKSQISTGNYKLRVFTKNFIITSKIAISTSSWLLKSNNSVATLND